MFAFVVCPGTGELVGKHYSLRHLFKLTICLVLHLAHLCPGVVPITEKQKRRNGHWQQIASLVKLLVTWYFSRQTPAMLYHLPFTFSRLS